LAVEGESVTPVGKVLYVGDEVLEDSNTGKTHLLGLFNVIRTPGGTTFPFYLKRLCAFAQFVDGVGEVPIHLEVVNVATQKIVFRSPERTIHFPNRQTTVTAVFRLLNCRFPEPGVYLVELHAADTFVDDRILHVLREDGGE
jgi:hypothetical protein